MDSKYYIVRAKDAGVFAGNIKERNGTEVKMTNVRQLWYWDGTAQRSTDGHVGAGADGLPDQRRNRSEPYDNRLLAAQTRIANAEGAKKCSELQLRSMHLPDRLSA